MKIGIDITELAKDNTIVLLIENTDDNYVFLENGKLPTLVCDFNSSPVRAITDYLVKRGIKYDTCEDFKIFALADDIPKSFNIPKPVVIGIQNVRGSDSNFPFTAKNSLADDMAKVFDIYFKTLLYIPMGSCGIRRID
ncbi:hypothetical protein D3C81_07770 [compost metagenome]